MLQLPQQVLTAIDVLEKAGYEAYLVGGAVRDYARGKPAKDWDITTNALPQQVEQAFDGYRIIETGLKHGTLTVLLDNEPLEITTYRIDGEYTDHRRPDSVTFTPDLKEDLSRRDFTMNALAYHPVRGFVDLFDGLQDLHNGVIRCVGDPALRFSEDALRILRALRFASVLQMEIETNTAAALYCKKELLRTVAAERIREELTKLLTGPYAGRILREYSVVLLQVLPELKSMFAFMQYNPYHDKDVWNHTVAVVEASPADPILRWAALLHDIGKPRCFTRDETGRGHFYGHPEQSAVIADAILRRLRFDNASRERIVTLVKAHDRPIEATRKSLKRCMNRYGVEITEQLLQLHTADTLGQSAFAQKNLPVYRQAKEILDQLVAEKACVSVQQLEIDGNDAVAVGFKGREVGCALEGALQQVMEERIPNERQPLLDYLHFRFAQQTK